MLRYVYTYKKLVILYKIGTFDIARKVRIFGNFFLKVLKSL